MTDELCDKCGIGFFLPSGRCDHCNCLQCLAHVRELLTPQEKATHEKWEREAKSAELQRVIEARGLSEKYKDVDTSQADIPYAVGGFNAAEKVSPEHLERTFNARRRGAIQALKAIAKWAYVCMEFPQEDDALMAYKNCVHESERLIREFETKAGAELYFGLNWKETLWLAYRAGCSIDDKADDTAAKEKFEEWFKNLGRPENCR